MTEEILAAVVREAVKSTLKECAGTCHCNLEAVQITPVIHQDHHQAFATILQDLSKIRTALLVSMSLGLGGGMLGLIWLGLKVKVLS